MIRITRPNLVPKNEEEESVAFGFVWFWWLCVVLVQVQWEVLSDGLCHIAAVLLFGDFRCCFVSVSYLISF